MKFTRLLACVPALTAAVVLLASCGGGSSSDVRPGTPPVVAPTSGPDSFLLFPNPQVQADGSLQTNTPAYAEAYYAAIDPTNAKDTLAKWRAANNFDTGTGTQITVVFGDQRDLGYGRRMTARQNADGTLAFVVENYLVNAGAASYSADNLPINLEAAIVRDPKSFLGINAIEFSPGPAGGVSFAKFFNFNPVTGQRENALDLDGRGNKFMPGPCITCHGGRGDALTPPDATGKPRFNLVQSAVSQTRGDVQARLHPFEADAFLFSSTPGFTRAEQEAQIKTINKMILCSYPRTSATTFPEDACRRLVGPSDEWRGSAAEMLKSFYGGDGLPNAAFSDTYIPLAWQAAGQTTLYRSVIAPACRTCHLMRGTGAQSDIDFDTFAKFETFAERTRTHVFDRGNMPLAKIVFDAFYASSRPETLATFLQDHSFPVDRDPAGVILRPGRPIADPGPDRVIRQGATRLSATGSLFANAYAWSIVSGPNGATPPTGATLVDANTALPTFNAAMDGTYVLSLVASSGSAQSAPKQVTLVVDSSLAIAPSAIRFSDIKTAMQTGDLCTSCHRPGGSPLPPVFFSNDDRNGDGSVGNATDDAWFYAEVRSRINFTEIAASPLLRKPSGNHHSGGLLAGFNASATPGQLARSKYDLFLNWILNGAPQ